MMAFTATILMIRVHCSFQVKPSDEGLALMDTIIVLLLSALLGFAVGLCFEVQAVAALSVLIALSSAIMVRASGFEFATGVAVITGCLTVSQLGYILSFVFRALIIGLALKGIPSQPKR